MFLPWKHKTREGEVNQAVAEHDEAVRAFLERLQAAEAAHSRQINDMLEGLIPTHKGSKQ